MTNRRGLHYHLAMKDVEQRQTGMRREQRVMLALHRALVAELNRDPARVLEVGRQNISKRYLRAERLSPRYRSWLELWETAINEGPESVSELAFKNGELGDDLRQVSPFAGALTQEQRLLALKNA